MTAPRETSTALDAYMENHTAALALLERIQEAIASHDSSPDPEEINWCHVGDIASTRKELQDISDHLFSEGEHADIADLPCF